MFVRFLKQQGLRVKRTTASHEIWDRPDLPLQRPVVIRTTDRDIPMHHIATNLRTLHITQKEFDAFLRKN